MESSKRLQIFTLMTHSANSGRYLLAGICQLAITYGDSDALEIVDAMLAASALDHESDHEVSDER